MRPEWIMVVIAIAGLVFQAGIGWAMLISVNRTLGDQLKKSEEHADRLSDHHAKLNEHERWLERHEAELRGH